MVAGGATEPGEPVFHLTFAEAALHGAELDILHADRHPQLLTPGLAPAVRSTRADGVDAEHRALELRIGPLRARYRDLPATVRVEHTSLRAALVAASRHARLLVGSHGRNGIPRLRSGSVSSDVLHRAYCPVLVAPAGGGLHPEI